MKKGLLKNNFSKWMAGTALAAGLSVLPMQKAQSQELLAFNDNAKAKTEVTTDKTILMAPHVEHGGSGDAQALSDIHNTVGLYVRGGSDGQAKKAAGLLASAFADRRYTDKPLNIVVVYGDAGGDAETTVYFDGNAEYLMPLADTGKKLDAINEAFVGKFGNDLVLPESVTTASIQTPGM